MQKRAGLLFLSKKTKRILLILEDSKWTVPTFFRNNTLLQDSNSLMSDYSHGKLIPIELYLSADKGFEYGTYICLVEDEFLTLTSQTIAWASLEYLPKNLHNGLKATLTNQQIKTKIETIIEFEKVTTQI
jgi:hypothetical protein